MASTLPRLRILGLMKLCLWFKIFHYNLFWLPKIFHLIGPSPNEKRFKKRYFTFWNNYNIIMDMFFMIGLIIKIIDYIFLGGYSEISVLSSAGRILWGIAFTFAIIKIIKIGIASKYFGPIILSINAMMKVEMGTGFVEMSMVDLF